MIYKKFLNNTKYETFNFVFPNTFIQNGNDMYFIDIENGEMGISAKLTKLNIIQRDD